MSKQERTGNRKSREHRSKKKTVEMGYYIVITDTRETERLFFEGLHRNLPKDIQRKLVVKVVNTKTSKLIDSCLKEMAYISQYSSPWIVFDRDQVVNFDKIISEAESRNINVGWSNPCFEIWLHTYFGKMPTIQESKQCCRKFGELYQSKTGIEYKKDDNDLYQRLIRYGDESDAIKISKQRYESSSIDYSLPSEMCPCTTVYKLVDEIRNKVNE